MLTGTSTQIPAITYGGPKHAPEEPSSEATPLIESMVIVEFLGELFPAANLIPRDPVLHAKARIFASIVDTKLLDGLREFFFLGGPVSGLLAGFEALQALLPPTGFAVGEWSTADIAAAPYLVRMLMLLEHEIGKYPVGEGKKTLGALREPKFARIMKYVEDAKAWPSFRDTWDEVRVFFACLCSIVYLRRHCRLLRWTFGRRTRLSSATRGWEGRNLAMLSGVFKLSSAK